MKRNILKMADIYCSLFLHFVFPDDVFFNTWTSNPDFLNISHILKPIIDRYWHIFTSNTEKKQVHKANLRQSLTSKHIKSDLFFVCFYAATKGSVRSQIRQV